MAAVAACVTLAPLRAHAQWWSTRAPVDFEDCADLAEKAATNPTKEEQKHIDEQYTVFLDKQRRSFIAASLAAKQEQQTAERPEKAALPVVAEAAVKPKATGADLKARAKAQCAKHSTFSCEWPVLSEKITNLKKALFGSSQAKAKRGGLSSHGEASGPVQSAAR